MTGAERETSAAVEALTYRIKARDAAIRAGEDVPDAEPFAAEYVAGLRGHGWRLTEAKVVPAWKAPVVKGDGPSEETRALLRQALGTAEAAAERIRAAGTRQDGAA